MLTLDFNYSLQQASTKGEHVESGNHGPSWQDHVKTGSIATKPVLKTTPLHLSFMVFLQTLMPKLELCENRMEAMHLMGLLGFNSASNCGF